MKKLKLYTCCAMCSMFSILGIYAVYIGNKQGLWMSIFFLSAFFVKMYDYVELNNE